MWNFRAPFVDKRTYILYILYIFFQSRTGEILKNSFGIVTPSIIICIKQYAGVAGGRGGFYKYVNGSILLGSTLTHGRGAGRGGAARGARNIGNNCFIMCAGRGRVHLGRTKILH